MLRVIRRRHDNNLNRECGKKPFYSVTRKKFNDYD